MALSDLTQNIIRIDAEEVTARMDKVHDLLIERRWDRVAAMKGVQALAAGGYFNRPSDGG